MNTNLQIDFIDTIPKRPDRAPRHPRTKNVPISILPSGSHTGGNCDSCGKNLAYWLDYKLCDGCVNIRPGAVTDSAA
jgi:hypothetical protein